MPGPLPILGGAYKNRSLIAAAQRNVNLYLEKNPPGSQSPVPFTLYPRAGLRKLASAPSFGIGRGLYQDTAGQLYAVIGNVVYYIDNTWTYNAIGNIAAGKSIVSMADNGTTILMVDGTPAGYQIDVQSKSFLTISDPAFYGGDHVDYLRTVFTINRPGTRQFYISGSNAATWDPLDFGAKTSSADPLYTSAALNDQLWLLGTRKGEVWYFSGDALFPFQQMPGVIIEHGCAAKYSVSQTDKFLHWLTQDKDGKPWIARGASDYSVTRVSTSAIEAEIQNYVKWDDCVSYTYQQFGHTFVDFVFPSADKTWSIDLSTDEWAEYVSIDVNGNEHRMKGFLSAYCYNTNVMLDWKNGDLYALDPNYFADNIDPIKCVRGFPHMGSNGSRVIYGGFIADMDVGQVKGMSFDPSVIQSPWSAGFSDGFGPFYEQDVPQIRCRFSNTRGYTWGNRRSRSLGATGQYKTVAKWANFGEARDGVFEIEWAIPCATALNGGFLSPDPQVSES